MADNRAAAVPYTLAKYGAPWPALVEGGCLTACQPGPMLAGLPRRAVTTPAAIVSVTAGRSLRPIWENVLGGLTFEVGTRNERCFVITASVNSAG